MYSKDRSELSLFVPRPNARHLAWMSQVGQRLDAGLTTSPPTFEDDLPFEKGERQLQCNSKNLACRENAKNVFPLWIICVPFKIYRSLQLFPYVEKQT